MMARIKLLQRFRSRTERWWFQSPGNCKMWFSPSSTDQVTR
jgi:hypothetical protein